MIFLNKRKERMMDALSRYADNDELRTWALARLKLLHGLSEEVEVNEALGVIATYLCAYERLMEFASDPQWAQWAEDLWSQLAQSDPGPAQDVLLAEVHTTLDEAMEVVRSLVDEEGGTAHCA